jgi:phosphatidylglycerol---prolipoprotein diacylglyceryl transferase
VKLHFAPELLHVYGQFGIQYYGIFIVIGIVVTTILLRRDKRFTELKLAKSYLDIITISIIAGCIGGRVLEVLSEPTTYPHWQDWFALWQGGFSVLGSILGIVLIVPLYLKKINVPIIPFFDLISIYAPLLQSIARLGCFTAGCCYGIPTTTIFGVQYTNITTLAPYNITIHPTQLYSAALLFCIFLFMFYIGQHILTKKGQLFATYLILASAERFVVDFWRAERIMINSYFSFHQCVALTIIGIILLCNSIFPPILLSPSSAIRR